VKIRTGRTKKRKEISKLTLDPVVMRDHDFRDKHTPTARSLDMLPSRPCVIDTSGMRTLRPVVGAEALGALFEDASTLELYCRFRECAHLDERGFAERVRVNPEGLNTFSKMLRESRRDAMSVMDRQQQLFLWNARGRVGLTRRATKRNNRWSTVGCLHAN
jgi:ribosome biogenesis GTPase